MECRNSTVMSTWSAAWSVEWGAVILRYYSTWSVSWSGLYRGVDCAVECKSTVVYSRNTPLGHGSRNGVVKEVVAGLRGGRPKWGWSPEMGVVARNGGGRRVAGWSPHFEGVGCHVITSAPFEYCSITHFSVHPGALHPLSRLSMFSK
eukprot:COSAG02_NODE_469_length_21727_cov_64.506334_2_plen_148_part_00